MDQWWRGHSLKCLRINVRSLCQICASLYDISCAGDSQNSMHSVELWDDNLIATSCLGQILKMADWRCQAVTLGPVLLHYAPMWWFKVSSLYFLFYFGHVCLASAPHVQFLFLWLLPPPSCVSPVSRRLPPLHLSFIPSLSICSNLFLVLLLVLDFCILPQPFLGVLPYCGLTLCFWPLPASITFCLINHCTEPAKRAVFQFESK